ncbi:MAG TPA: cytochrome d ubiquinol oxidase subunit II, partial [Candidatus Polarisedimenticolia bacterium]|nr:cytochrome d ubiquinol oxidase subunit II [Candidatus Polarisedimenticolia bacterium]
DGFDLGAGALHLLVAKNDRERRQVLAAIGPFWDGNEVWLLATGGILFVAFPAVLASALSGFYLAIILVVWCLMLRGIAIEFRSHLGDRLWRAAWDVVFAIASTLLCVFLGAALGNLLRGVPLDAHGWFALALFTDWSARPPVGILDWYTVLVGVFALASLAGHGGAWLAYRTDGAVRDRSRRLARALFLGVAALWIPVTVASALVNRDFGTAFGNRPFLWTGGLLALVGLVTAVRDLGGRGRPGRAFLGSCAFLAGLLVATAAGSWPVMLRSTGDPALSLTAPGTAASPAGLRTALGWWVVAFPLAIGYLVLLLRLHRGKAVAAADGEGY